MRIGHVASGVNSTRRLAAKELVKLFQLLHGETWDRAGFGVILRSAWLAARRATPILLIARLAIVTTIGPFRLLIMGWPSDKLEASFPEMPTLKTVCAMKPLTISSLAFTIPTIARRTKDETHWSPVRAVRDQTVEGWRKRLLQAPVSAFE
ncbi:unnamed protein product [Linum trigynum]|uniref:Uncharacterized protein n=1 Tax=Linum trigynum TaxID=586398 RepID=A0AAV2CH83_9ROSI